MLRCLAYALLLLVPLASVFSGQDAEKAEELTDKNYDTMRDYILPQGDEEKWKEIDWRPTFWDGVIDANKLDKPIMIYAMNGHPFGCV